MQPTVRSAIEFAKKAHGNQTYGKHPYSYHLAHVAETLERFHKDLAEAIAALNIPYDSWICSAWLHDTLEDTPTTFQDLIQHFGPQVAELVKAVTNEPGSDHLLVAQQTYPNIGKTPGATLLKLADRIANVETSIQDQNEQKLDKYRKMFPLMKQHLRANEGKQMWLYLEDILLSGKAPSV